MQGVFLGGLRFSVKTEGLARMRGRGRLVRGSYFPYLFRLLQLADYFV